MGKNVPHPLKKITPFIGRQVLDIITSGMYDNPLMILREFIQNSADSIDEKYKGKTQKNGFITINIDGKNRSITITDNGCGIRKKLAVNRLIDIGHSHKEGGIRRGFRGIGRLGALAYANSIRFETRSSSNEPISVVEWDGVKLREIAKNKNKTNLTLEECVGDVIKIATKKASKDDLPNFFRVHILKINPFHKDELMNVIKVRNYLKQVAPVPMREEFAFSIRINDHLSEVEDYRSYNIFVNDVQLFRPFCLEYPINKKNTEKIKDINIFDFKNRDGDKIALGWYAKTNCLATIPKNTLVRGIRIRKGNIEVGDEYYLQDYFTEARFASWHIGEIHIVSSKIKENARRDGFEQSSEFELLLEKCSVLCRHLSNMCRASSKERSTIQSIIQKIEMAETLLDPKQVFIGPDHRSETKEHITKIIQSLKDSIGNDRSLEKKVSSLEKRSKMLSSTKFVDLKSQLDGRILRNKENKALIAEICTSLRSIHSKNMPVEDLIRRVVQPYLREHSR